MKFIASPLSINSNPPSQHISHIYSSRSSADADQTLIQPADDFIVRLFEGKSARPTEDRNRYNLIMCLDGSLQYSSDSGIFSLLAGGAYFSAPGRTTHLVRQSDDAKFYEVSFKEGFISRNMLRETMLDRLLDTCGDAPAICYPVEKEIDFVIELFAKLYNEVNSRQVLHNQMVKLIFIEIMIGLVRSNEHCANRVFGNVPYHRAGQLYNQFTELVEKHYLKFRLVQDYADLLFVTAKHLSEVIKKETGQTALSLIHSKVFSEAKFLLCRTELSVKEIADSLNFDTSSHFGRFIKQFSGYNPSDYRSIQCAIL